MLSLLLYTSIMCNIFSYRKLFFKSKHKFQKMVPPYTFADVLELCFLHVQEIHALLNTTSFFPTRPGIFYYAFQHICILQEYLNCCKNISYTFFKTSCTCRKHVSGTFEKCGPLFYLGVAQLENLFSYLTENVLHVCVVYVLCRQLLNLCQLFAWLLCHRYFNC